MRRLIGRQRELEELNAVLSSGGAQFLLIYGRRRVGKTTLVLHWAEKTGRPFLYWVATRDTPVQLRADFSRTLWNWAYPESRATPHFNSWKEVFEVTAELLKGRSAILIMDEFSYAAESDPSLPSSLQAAWDHLFRERGSTVVLTDSQIGLMTRLMGYDAPLYGRFTAQLPVEPLPFPALRSGLDNYFTASNLTTT